MGIKNKNNAMYFATGIDNSGLSEDAEQGKKIVRDMTDDIVAEGSKMRDAFAKAGTGVVSITDKIKELKIGINQTEADIKTLQNTFENAAPGKAKMFALQELEAAQNEKPFALLSLLFALLSAGTAAYVWLKRKTQMEGKGQTEEDEQQEAAETRKHILITALAAGTILLFLFTTGWHGVTAASLWTVPIGILTAAILWLTLGNKLLPGRKDETQ